MKQRDKYGSPFDSAGRKIGIGLTVAVHLLLLTIGISSGLRYVYPPPAEQGILIDFEAEEEITPIQTAVGVEPRAENADPDNDIRLVQKSEAPVAAPEAVNHGTETTVGTEGDVEVPEPPRPKPIDQRALFSSNRHRNDTIAQQVAEKVSDALTSGHPKGNTETGNPEGTPSAKLEGRTIMGNLPLPQYEIAKSGTVVVRILVDQYGNVTDAYPGAKGTTVNDAKMWQAAKEAALKAKFNISASAPAVQEGTISYVFILK